MLQNQTIEDTVRTYILKEFLPEEDPSALKDSTPLITSGILDSLTTLKLVAFLEKTFDMEVRAFEADVEHLNTIADIAQLVSSKRAVRGS